MKVGLRYGPKLRYSAQAYAKNWKDRREAIGLKGRFYNRFTLPGRGGRTANPS